jgi:hypothetical protein|tara:strand:+ start:655 stop:2193 length:1539 start_codon:yes stop_codon:yes gene_type:complete
MAKETIVLEAEIKSNIGEVKKETKELTNEFGAFGITIGGIKDKFKDIAKIMNNGLKQVALQAKLAGVGFKKMFSGQIIGGAKTLFTVIKTGIAATGIGALVVAFVSLATYFTQTKKGAELLEKTLKTIGAAVSVITDRVAKFGGAVVKFFSGDLKGAAEDAKAAVSGVVAEISEEVAATNKMVTANQKLRDSQRELNVETAQSVADIEKLKLIAEDITKSYEEREEAATQAFQKETELENKRIALAEEAVRLKQQEVDMSESTAEDLDALAELEINLANVRQESAGRQISLQNFLNGLRNEELSKLEEIKAAEIERFEGIEKLVTETVEANDQLIQADNSVLDNYLANNEDMKKSDEAMKVAKLGVTSAIGSAIGALGNLMAEGTAASKAAALAEIAISTGVGIVQGLDIAQKSSKAAGPAAAFAFPLFYATQLAAVLGAAAQAKSILGAGGGVTPPSTPPPSVQTPSPQMMSGAFDISGGVAPEPLQAFVLTDSMTNSQNQLANIRRRATI